MTPSLLTRGLLCAALLLGQPMAHAAGAADFAHKKKLGFDTTAAGADLKEEVAALPVLVRLHSGNLTFNQVKPEGADLRFFSADGKTPLKHHIENFDAANELANVWVALPKLSANAKTDSLLIAWGADKPGTESDAKGTYDAAQVLVYHFGGDGAPKDATGNGNDAKAATAKPQAAGQIGAAAVFDGRARIDVAASPTLKFAPAAGLTFTAWVKPAALGAATLYAQGGKALVIGLGGDGKLTVSASGASVSAGTPLKAATWQHVAVVLAGGKASLYADGLEVGNGALVLADVGGDAVIGEGFQGELDELTLAAAARPPAYIKALALSQAADSPMVAVADEEGGGEGVSYFRILIDSVTIDGWIVIGLLGVMGAVSAWVMVTKAVMLRAAHRANLHFLAAFKRKPIELLTPGHADVATLQADGRVKRSSVYRLYEIGMAEVSRRFADQARHDRPQRLSSAGLEAIRASLDAAMLRENQRFNSGIVLLTIAISGGPFLGLLGTVVGVMITFAAIAAAGEVNVNSIAPGIAAALVATVAGLGVAIPALFGYNWLASQIKNLSGDTQVFLDEFVTRSAELHAD